MRYTSNVYHPRDLKKQTKQKEIFYVFIKIWKIIENLKTLTYQQVGCYNCITIPHLIPMSGGVIKRLVIRRYNSIHGSWKSIIPAVGGDVTILHVAHRATYCA